MDPKRHVSWWDWTMCSKSMHFLRSTMYAIKRAYVIIQRAEILHVGHAYLLHVCLDFEIWIDTLRDSLQLLTRGDNPRVNFQANPTANSVDFGSAFSGNMQCYRRCFSDLSSHSRRRWQRILGSDSSTQVFPSFHIRLSCGYSRNTRMCKFCLSTQTLIKDNIQG